MIRDSWFWLVVAFVAYWLIGKFLDSQFNN